jgi:transporter family protein
MSHSSWIFWAFLSAIFAAMTAIFTKLGVNTINSDFATFIRTCVILVLVGGITFFSKQFQPLHAISGKGLTFLILSGAATGASWLCYFRAMKLGQASQVAPIDKLSVVFVAVLGVFMLGEHLSTINWLGIALITSGVILVAFQG